MPPSPSLSARRTKTTYLSETIAISARPEDQRHHPQDIGGNRRGMAGGIQGDGKGVERARADIAEHDAKRGEREEPAAPFMGKLAGARPLGG
jgi:hypothetical protein